ncbi:neuropeptides B/W receptor type 2 [Rhynchocyon petersi]
MQETGHPDSGDLKLGPQDHRASSSPPTTSIWSTHISSDNRTSPEPLPELCVALPIVYSVICVVGLAGNTAVIWVMLRAPRKTATDVFLLHLAIADSLFALVLPVSVAEHLLRRWPFGDLLCKVVLAADHYNIFCSVYFLAAVSLDRYLAVRAAAQSRRAPRLSLRQAQLASLGVWLAVSTMVLPFLAFAGIYRNDLQVTSCGLSFPWPEQTWLQASRIYTLVLGFIVPVGTMCTLYSGLLCRLRGAPPRSGTRALGRARRKATGLVLAVLAVCLVCWVPFHLASVVALATDLPPTPLVIAASYAITSLSYTSSCLNPFLYAFLDSRFRKNLRSLCQGSRA